MTAREKINGRKRWLMFAVVLGIGSFIAAAFLGGRAGQGEPYLFALPGFLVAFLGVLCGQYFWFRCPWCRGNLAPLAFHRPGGLNRQVKFCPYCGHELDDELPNGDVVRDDDPF
jgi:hypothetical protein